MSTRVTLATVALVLTGLGLAGTCASYMLMYGTTRGKRLSLASVLVSGAGVLIAMGVIISGWVTS